MVRSVEDVKESQVNKVQRGLMPPRIEMHQTGIAVKLERANFATGRNKSQNRNDAQAQTCKPRLNRKTRALRLNRANEQHVQQRLVPYYVRGIGQWWPGNMRERRFVRTERKIRWEGDARRHHLRIRQQRVAFVNLEESGDPQLRRAGKQRRGTLQIEVAGPSLGKEAV